MENVQKPLKALILNCTLKRSPAVSNTDALAQVVIDELKKYNVETKTIRVVDLTIMPGVTSDEGNGDEWPLIHQEIIAADILVMASPTWIGHPSSIAQRVIERLDAMITEKDSAGRPICYNKVAGVVVTGNEDGAHHVISEISGALIDIGFTIPGSSWTYWHMGPGPGENYLDTDYKHAWSKTTGQTAAQNLIAVALGLQSSPLPIPITS